MTSLNCTALNCTYNCDSYCSISSINVGGKHADKSKATCCASFEESNGAFTNDVRTPNPQLDINCEAENCVYNSNCHCEAQAVDISGASACNCEETKCSTFQYKG